MASKASSRLADALGHGVVDKRIEILRGVLRSGSISQAAREAAVSYKAAWQAIATLTNLAGVTLVERAVGGSGGGGATLTRQGLQLLDLAEAMALARDDVQSRARVAAGRGAAGAASAVARLAIQTSMRNQLPVIVLGLERSGRIVRVRMGLAPGADISARITLESAELLGLSEGMAALALCKATAVRVDRAGAGRVKGNRLDGVVASAARGDDGDEISLALAGGLQLVGFAAGGTALRARQRATACVDEAAVVVALPG